MGCYILETTASGHPTMVYRNSSDVRLHSAYDPVRESERAVAAFVRGRANVIMVSGCGLGYHVRELRRTHPDARIIIVERDEEAARIALKECPGNLQGSDIVHTPGQLAAVFEEMSAAEIKGISHYVHRPSYRISPDFYEDMYRDAGRIITSKASDLLTRFEFEEKWIGNVLSNLHLVFESGRAADLFGRFRGYPGVIVSAGPSLRKNARLLGGIRDRALIVCVDTAAKVLDKIGVVPHLIMTLDAQKNSLRHFLGLRAEGAVLIGDVVSCPAVMERYRGGRIFSTTAKYYSDKNGAEKRETTPLMDWLEKFMPPLGDIQSGGSVATSAFDLLLNLGCDPIVLVGQDLAYTGREIHCSGTHHNDDWLPTTSRLCNLDTINQRVVRKRKIKYLEAYGGSGRVISDFVLDLYRGWFEDSAGKVPVRVVNSTEGGARIGNTAETPLGDALDGRRKNAATPAEILRSAAGKKSDPGPLIRELEAATESLSALAVISSEENVPQDEKSAEIERFIEGTGLWPVLGPMLRKTRAYLARQDLERERGCRIFNDDVASASKKLASLLSESVRRLKSIKPNP